MKTAFNNDRGKDTRPVQKTSANRDIYIFYSVRLKALRIGDEITALSSYQ